VECRWLFNSPVVIDPLGNFKLEWNNGAFEISMRTFSVKYWAMAFTQPFPNLTLFEKIHNIPGGQAKTSVYLVHC
jgi:hypothetical protein